MEEPKERRRVYTVKEVSEKLGLTRDMVVKLCVLYGVKKFGRDYAINEYYLGKMRNRNSKRGRPKKKEIDWLCL